MATKKTDSKPDVKTPKPKVTCPDCNGTGLQEEVLCATCEGSGLV